ncbi:hypothetical protein CDD82_1133 [Ophiocordyceps australis]|uniref:Nuclear protein Qri2/Nse4 n=1 Tax=Ophiocordyceps australis TaxID=1399860 RepID=A0A2C5XPE6_9HYPO|nr:hypothetical protein CDD82_1133 [Ophiocordyceps australis]
MSSSLIPQKPQDVMVIRNVTPSTAIMSVPFSRFGRIKIGGRGTVVKMTSGSLAVFSPVALTDAAKAKVDEMGGDVGYLVALDIEHHIFLSQGATAFPNAKLVGPEGLAEKRAKQQASDDKIGSEQIHVVFTRDNKHQQRIGDDFDADFEYEYVDGHANRELVFLYRPDATLIQADLLFNLPPREQYSRVPEADTKPGVADGIFQGVQSVDGEAKWVRRFNWYMAAKDRTSFNQSVRRIAGWQFTRIIPCHGDVIERDAKGVFDKVFKWHLA